VLNFIYYPVSFILWCWHQVFGWLIDPASGIAWALAVVFLVFTLRALLFKPFVSQVRSMRKMQQFAPEMQKLKKKYGNDRQKMAAEMQKLQKDHGFNPAAGCLPVLVQIPVFIGLFQVLKEFKPGKTQNYFFDQAGVESFLQADFFGAKLGAWVAQGEAALEALGTSVANMVIVMIPLMIAAGVFTHITARHSVARQTEAQAANPQAAIMNKLMLYVFPIGVVVGAPFLPLAVLIYWVANNLWTLGQQWVVYRRIDAEELTKREEAAAARQARAPRPGQKPVRPGTGLSASNGATPQDGTAPKDATGPDDGAAKDAADAAATDGTATDGTATPAGGKAPGGKPSTAKGTGAKTPGAKPVARKPQPAGGSGGSNDDGQARGAKAPGNAAGGHNGRSGTARPPARRGRKRR
jgi:YidC/Oxa1 family membrane protein insertase